ncbi:MAG: hypothetical protein HKN90_07075 [Flavobacteriaceae bacterium]|nr:hypothetical protein [Flavobacteriaceae bacterium]
MITYLTRKELNTEKYNRCIKNAINSRIYAYSWYLDCVADQWDVLVAADYEAVMPLPWRKKYLVKYIYLPVWIQQLGVFYNKKPNSDLVPRFLKAIPKKFKFIELNLNADNSIQNKFMTPRINYVLNLNTSYQHLVDNYNKGRKSDLKSARKHMITFKNSNNALDLITIFKEVKGHDVQLKNADYKLLEQLTTKLVDLNKMVLVEAFNEENEIIGGILFLIDSSRITYLFSVSTSEGREKNIISLIIDDVLKKYANSKRIFDFEGSMMPNVASFFRSFGAIQEEYYHYRKYRL